MTTSTPQRRVRARYVVIAVLAVAALAAGIVVPRLSTSQSPNLSATDRIQADPPPTLFGDSQIKTVDGPIAAQDAVATAAMSSWWKKHGSAPDDKAFVTWVETQVPQPPSTSARAKELRTVQALKTRRTPRGVAAATWLEVHGKKDIWKLYLHDQRELETKATGKADKKDLKLILSMSKTAADELAATDRQSAPYVLDPSLRTDKTVKKGAECPCSYPSRHAARAAGSRLFLGHIAPRRLADYRWMEDEVTYSRLYMAGHVPSDITAGSRLGDMIGEYVLVSRGRMPMPTGAA
jgi:membrane-associated phospholipid phosphatase